MKCLFCGEKVEKDEAGIILIDGVVCEDCVVATIQDTWDRMEKD